MKSEFDLQDARDIPQLLALDEPSSCTLCRASDTTAARATLAELGTWWLDPAQRAFWKVNTLIRGKKRPAGTASDAVFKIIVPSRPMPLPAFLILTQHWEGKQHPHYQLQIPDRAELLSAAGTAAEPAVADLIDATDQRVAHLRVSGKQSISLHEPFGTMDMGCVKSALGDLVIKLQGLL